MAVTSAGVEYLAAAAAEQPDPEPQSTAPANVDGHTLICQFGDWKVYEDLHTRDGAITFVSARGPSRVLAKTTEATFAEANPPYLGLKMADIGTSGPDLLADKLLESGDPDPERVRLAAPPLGSGGVPGRGGFSSGSAGRWNTFVGTKECLDTMPVFPAGNTRTYHPNQYFPEMRDARNRPRHGRRNSWRGGLLGGWMPAAQSLSARRQRLHRDDGLRRRGGATTSSSCRPGIAPPASKTAR